MSEMVALMSGFGIYIVLKGAPNLDAVSTSRLLVAAGLGVLCLGAVAASAVERIKSRSGGDS